MRRKAETAAMLETLSTSELSNALRDVKSALASTYLSAAMERHLAEVSATGTVLRSDTPETLQLRQFVLEYSGFLTQAAIGFFSETALFRHRLPCCNALARETQDGIPYVLICEGLIQITGYRQALNILVHNLQLMLEKKVQDPETAQAHLTTLTFNALAYSYWSYLAGEQLPDLAGLFGTTHKSNLTIGLAGASAFVIMHEIGHIRLGHTREAHPAPPQIYTSLPFEDMTALKAMELEADRFAIACVKDELKPSMAASALIILDVFSDFECMCLPRSASHPLVINRIASLSEAMRLDSDPFFIGHVQAFLARKQGLLKARDTTFPEFASANSKIARRDAEDKFLSLLPSLDECRKSIAVLAQMYDGHDYTEPEV